jgi:hypothetical protein
MIMILGLRFFLLPLHSSPSSSHPTRLEAKALIPSELLDSSDFFQQDTHKDVVPLACRTL